MEAFGIWPLSWKHPESLSRESTWVGHCPPPKTKFRWWAMPPAYVDWYMASLVEASREKNFSKYPAQIKSIFVAVHGGLGRQIRNTHITDAQIKSIFCSRSRREAASLRSLLRFSQHRTRICQKYVTLQPNAVTCHSCASSSPVLSNDF